MTRTPVLTRSPPEIVDFGLPKVALKHPYPSGNHAPPLCSLSFFSLCLPLSPYLRLARSRSLSHTHSFTRKQSGALKGMKIPHQSNPVHSREWLFALSLSLSRHHNHAHKKRAYQSQQKGRSFIANIETMECTIVG